MCILGDAKPTVKIHTFPPKTANFGPILDLVFLNQKPTNGEILTCECAQLSS